MKQRLVERRWNGLTPFDPFGGFRELLERRTVLFAGSKSFR
jgi:hypothetical protein